MYLDLLRFIVPETIVAIAAFIVLAADLGVARKCSIRCRQNLAAVLATVGCFVSIIWMTRSAAVRVPDTTEIILSVASGNLGRDGFTEWLSNHIEEFP